MQLNRSNSNSGKVLPGAYSYSLRGGAEIQHPITKVAPAGPSSGDSGAIRSRVAFFTPVARHWKLALVIASASAFLLYSMLGTQTPVFQSESHLVVRTSGPDEASGGVPIVLNRHRLEIQSRTFLKYLYEALSDSDRKAFLAGSRNADDDADSAGAAGAEMWAFIKKISGALSIELVADSPVLQVSLRHTDAGVATRINNHLLACYMDYVEMRDVAEKEDLHEQFVLRAKELRTVLEATEADLVAYRRDHGLFGESGQHELYMAKIRSADDRLEKAEHEHQAVRHLLKQISETKGEVNDLLAIDVIASYPGMQAMKEQWMEKLREKAELEAKDNPDSAEFIRFNEELKTLEAAVSSLIRQVVLEQSNRDATLRDKVSDLQDRLAQAEALVLRMAEIKLDESALMRQLDSDRTSYDKTIALLHESRAALEQPSLPALRISDDALVADEPVAPDKSKALIMSGFSFLLLFLAIPLGINVVGKIRTGNALKSTLPQAIDVLSTIPKFPAAPEAQLLINAFRQGSMTRQLLERMARDIESLSPRPESRVVLVTSANPGEGKSLVSSALGAVHSLEGKSTLLIDCNVDRPSLGRWFGQGNASNNLRKVLSPDHPEKFNFESLRLGTGNLFVLQAGEPVIDAATDFACDAFGRFMKAARYYFDIIILDASEALGFAEFDSLVPYSSEIVMVWDEDLAGKEELVKAMEHVEACTTGSSPVISVVANGDNETAALSYKRAARSK